jgi:hypothetical protein
VKVTEKRVLARTAMMRHYPDDQGNPLPSWIGDLAIGPAPDFHTYDRLMHGGYIAWDNGWRLTEAGRRALDAAAPKESPLEVE